ncbi:hypothetical protein QBC47DRAFT_357079 [Echria macrotheca]|uniref:Uncharacterized protein n=1 Tax=Echria macrotheca TaxID=438768 RepID=A0AAJ0F9K7_9PEZI|nr:hypothetical protein QBC47DRAFT_357079 [Echria macrotheca]
MEPVQPEPSRKRQREPTPEPTKDGQDAERYQSSCIGSDNETWSGLPDDVFLPSGLSTHDTTPSSFHFESIQDFTKGLQSALDASWKTRQEPVSKYKAVKALLLSWEDDDLGVEAEIDPLAQLLENVYGYEVERWRIPSLGSFRALDNKVRASTESIWEVPSSLFILYYGGHARPSRGQGSFPRWSSKRFGATEVDPLSIQSYLENATCDVLFLYDCCHSIHAGSWDRATGIKEALAAGGFETIAAEVGEHSFTNLLTNELARAAEQGRGISVSDVHGYMLAGLRDYTPRLVKDSKGKLVLDCNKRPRFEPPRRRTPVHYLLSEKRESIVFAPLRSGNPPTSTMSLPPRGLPTLAAETDPEGSSTGFVEINAPQFPQVILSVRLQSSDSSEARAWVDWLLRAPPEVEDIKVEGWYGSFSTLIILSVPLKVWHAMQDHPAISFVGFVTTENLASALLPNKPSIARWLDNKTAGSTRPLTFREFIQIPEPGQNKGSNCAVKSFLDIPQVKRHVMTFHRQVDPEDGIDARIEGALNSRYRRIVTWEQLWSTLFPEDDITEVPDPVFVPPVEFEEGIELARESWADLDDRIFREAQKSPFSEWEPERVREIMMEYLLYRCTVPEKALMKMEEPTGKIHYKLGASGH